MNGRDLKVNVMSYYFKVSSQYSPGKTEENYANCHTGVVGSKTGRVRS
jgi:hypothetical protein